MTDTGGAVRSVVTAVTPGDDGEDILLRDWELLQEMNRAITLSGIKSAPGSPPPADINKVDAEIERTGQVLADRLEELSLPFKIPSCELMALILPAEAEGKQP